MKVVPHSIGFTSLIPGLAWLALLVLYGGSGIESNDITYNGNKYRIFNHLIDCSRGRNGN